MGEDDPRMHSGGAAAAATNAAASAQRSSSCSKRGLEMQEELRGCNRGGSSGSSRKHSRVEWVEVPKSRPVQEEQEMHAAAGSSKEVLKNDVSKPDADVDAEMASDCHLDRIRHKLASDVDVRLQTLGMNIRREVEAAVETRLMLQERKMESMQKRLLKYERGVAEGSSLKPGPAQLRALQEKLSEAMKLVNSELSFNARDRKSRAARWSLSS